MSMKIVDLRMLSNIQETQTVDDEQVIITHQLVLVKIECGTTADLPSMHYTTLSDNPLGTVTFAQGSEAHIITDNTKYCLMDNGTTDGLWVIQDEASRMNVYTKPEVDQLLQDMADSQANIDLAQDEITNRNQDLLAEIIDSGAKNKIEMTHAAGSVTRNGVTCTWDPDAGTMTLSGTHTSSDPASIFEFYSGNAVDQRVLPAGTYHLSGCIPGGSTATYRAALTSISGAVDTGNGATFTISEPTYGAYRILISGNCDFSTPAVFYPMVTPQDAYDISDAFEPYCPSLQELYQMVKSYHS